MNHATYWMRQQDAANDALQHCGSKAAQQHCREYIRARVRGTPLPDGDARTAWHEGVANARATVLVTDPRYLHPPTLSGAF